MLARETRIVGQEIRAARILISLIKGRLGVIMHRNRPCRKRKYKRRLRERSDWIRQPACGYGLE